MGGYMSAGALMQFNEEARREKKRIKKGDIVVFTIGIDTKEYRVLADEFVTEGGKAVYLDEYDGEVGVNYLKKVQ